MDQPKKPSLLSQDLVNKPASSQNTPWRLTRLELSTAMPLERTNASHYLNQPSTSRSLSTSQPSSTRKKRVSYYRLRRNLKGAINKATYKLDRLRELHLRTKTSFLESKKPVFDSCEYLHPLNFLDILTIYLKRVPESQKLDTVMECFGYGASDWAWLHREYWTNMEVFKQDFIHKHWGKSSQNQLRKKIANGSYKGEDGSMSRYFMNLVSQARWLPNQIPDEELVCDIMQHFPKQVQIAHKSQKRNVLETAEFLKRMDDVEMLSDLGEGDVYKKHTKSKYKLRVNENASNSDNNKTAKSGDSVYCNQSASKKIKL